MNKSVYWAKCGIGAIAVMGLALAGAQAQTIYQSETAAPGGSAHSMLVTFAKMAGREGINIQVNAGKTLTYYNVVREIRRVADYRGADTEIELPRTGEKGGRFDRVAVLVQEPDGGRIVGAAWSELK